MVLSALTPTLKSEVTSFLKAAMKPTFRKISRKFIKGEAFRARQLWLDFCDVAGTVLEALEPVKAAAWDWLEKWKKAFRTPEKAQEGPEQLGLVTESPANV